MIRKNHIVESIFDMALLIFHSTDDEIVEEIRALRAKLQSRFGEISMTPETDALAETILECTLMQRHDRLLQQYHLRRWCNRPAQLVDS